MIAIFFAVLLALAIPVLIYAWWSLAHAEPPLEMRSPDAAAVDTWECRVAVHEAGHAAAAWCCTLVPEVRVATIEAKHGGGTVSYTFLQVPGPDAAWCRTVIALAGVAAEASVYSRWKTAGSKEDIASALEHARIAGGSAPPWQRLGASGHKVPNFSRMFSHSLTEMDSANLEEAFRMARHLIRAHGARFFKLISHLLAVRTAKEVHLEVVLGPRHLERLAIVGADLERFFRDSKESALFRPQFVLPIRGKKAGKAA